MPFDPAVAVMQADGTFVMPDGTVYDGSGNPVNSNAAAAAGQTGSLGTGTAPPGTVAPAPGLPQGWELNPNFDSTLPPSSSNPQYVRAPAGSAGGSASILHTTERLIDPNQIAVEQVRAQNQIDIANLNNKLQYAKDATTRADLQAQIAQKYAEMSGNLPGGGTTLAAQQQQFNQFKSLSDIASNPRNFMQNFFLHRGQQPPAGSAAYSNLAGAPGQYALPPFAGGGTTAPSAGPAAPTTSASGPGPGNAQFQPSGLPTGTTPGANPQQPSSMLPSTGYRDPATINAVGGSSGYSAPGNAPAPVQTAGYDPVAAAAARAGGASYAYSGAPDPRALANNQQQSSPFSMASPQGQQDITHGANLTRLGIDAFARGGVTPEPIMGVGMHSNPELFQSLQGAPGHKYLIGEHGPEGVVPASYLPKFLQSRQGQQALPQHAGGLASSDTDYSTSSGGMSTAYGDGGMVGAPQGASGGDVMATWARGGRLAMPKFARSSSVGSGMFQPPPQEPSATAGGMMNWPMGVNSDITAMAMGGPLGVPMTPRPTYPMQRMVPSAGSMGVTGSTIGYADGGTLGSGEIDRQSASDLWGNADQYGGGPAPTAPAAAPVASASPSAPPGTLGSNQPAPGPSGGSMGGGQSPVAGGYPNNPMTGGLGNYGAGTGGPPGGGSVGAYGQGTEGPGGGTVTQSTGTMGGPAGAVNQYGYGQRNIQPTPPLPSFGGTMPPTGTGTPGLPNNAGFQPEPTAAPAYNAFDQTASGGPQGYGGGYNPYDTNPSYAGPTSPYDQLQQSGAIPPFLQRAMGQAVGNQAYGTNQPQGAYLPRGLPLESQLGYDQMSPAEQQALQSYASSYGIDPADYLAQIKQQTAPARTRQKFQFLGQ